MLGVTGEMVFGIGTHTEQKRPLIESLNSNAAPGFSWTPVSGASSYDVLAKGVVVGSTTAVSSTFAELSLPAGVADLQVRAVLASGEPGYASTSGLLRVQSTDGGVSLLPRAATPAQCDDMFRAAQ